MPMPFFYETEDNNTTNLTKIVKTYDKYATVIELIYNL